MSGIVGFRRPPVPGTAGFRRRGIRGCLAGIPGDLLICPYGTSIPTVRWAIRRLGRDAFRVVAYEATTAVFLDGDPEILPGLIASVRADIKAQIARLRSEGVTEFGFFGTSLDSASSTTASATPCPNCAGACSTPAATSPRACGSSTGPGGSTYRSGWSLDRLRRRGQGRCPEFGNLDGGRYVFVSSRRDKIAPLDNIEPYLGTMRQAGAQVSVLEVPAIGHFSTIVAGLWRAPRFVAMVRSGRLHATG